MKKARPGPRGPGFADLIRDWMPSHATCEPSPALAKELRPHGDVYGLSSKAKKADVADGKPVVQCLHPRLLLESGAVHTHGAQKYAMWNFTKGMELSRFVGAALRHLLQWWSGEDNDEETGKSHLAHTVCCVNMLWWCLEVGTGEDDRWRVNSKEQP